MFSGFSENKGLWGLLSLVGSQNLPWVNHILHLSKHFDQNCNPGKKGLGHFPLLSSLWQGIFVSNRQFTFLNMALSRFPSSPH